MTDDTDDHVFCQDDYLMDSPADQSDVVKKEQFGN